AKFTAIAIEKEKVIICGLGAAMATFKLVDPKCRFKPLKKDGSEVKIGDKIFEVKGNRSIFSAERTALNFIQRMSGIATATADYVKLSARAKITDTRKTAPGLRRLEKYAVKCGGGINHRFGLYDAILIKDNHIKAAGWENIPAKIKLLRKNRALKFIEIEAQNFAQVKHAALCMPDIIMLDNMSYPTSKKAVGFLRKNFPRIKIEISGGVNISNISRLASLGADRISVGAITHSPKALDISLEIL
ncbi:MAG: carboxylating nicotinate-nucleotide diphosphorylase, partial [Elusimicrobia bacterium]|nr:carboxylating nicotinate-nucleotide diphosphorylase [Elusimicrobiota bacterium]